MNKNDILDKAKSIINGERQGTYGNAENSFAVISQMWSAYLGRELTSADVANMMILMKVARNSSGVYKDDNWIDICGYAALGGDIQAKYDEPSIKSSIIAVPCESKITGLNVTNSSNLFKSSIRTTN